MELNFDLGQPKLEPVSLSAFEAAIKKKYHKSNQLTQISDFNKKSDIHSLGNNSDFTTSQFDLSSWKAQQQNAQKIDLFQEEGKHLLGQNKIVKYLDWRLTLADLFIHITTAILSIVIESYLLLLLRDSLIIVLSLTFLADYRVKLTQKCRQVILKLYKYALILSGSISIFTIGSIILFPEDSVDKVKYANYILVLFCFGILICEKNLWKACKYLLFFEKELERKENHEDIDFNDEF